MAQGTASSSSSSMDTESSAPQCSICLEVVVDNHRRSTARLQCGHVFHLDCIGSEFNIKGAMQCPNCRVTEHGKWLFAAGGFDQSIDNEDDDELHPLNMVREGSFVGVDMASGGEHHIHVLEQSLEEKLATHLVYTETKFNRLERKMAELYELIDSITNKAREKERDLHDRVDDLRVEIAECKKEFSQAREVVVKPRKKEASEPKEYDGATNARQIDNFFWHMQRYFECMEIEDDEKKMQTCTMYLTDTAALW
ncbi:uncharacterized protein LOC132273164 [Cornus florida]|uniref:uncharacterized protein LOC132273164 n=1 Tax=Cornus florida TaxID=4283 RepID=UPI00289E88A6|nr:uncharacterized protein LOC132273164 [Cornus florida]